MDDEAIEAKVRSTFPTLQDWKRQRFPTPWPELGSELHDDDQDWSALRVSEVARRGLQAATDHLLALRLHVIENQPFAFADMTLCRSALLGAATAVWVLVPPEPEVRITRARTVAFEEHKNHRTYLRELLATAPDHENTKSVLSVVESDYAELKVKRAEAGEGAALENTAVIREAVTAILDADHAVNAVLGWRSASGAAHGYAWEMLGTAGLVQSSEDFDDGTAEYSIGTPLRRWSNTYLGAFITAQRGWELLRQRSHKPVNDGRF